MSVVLTTTATGKFVGCPIEDRQRKYIVEHGDTKQSQFFPQVKFTGWDDDINVSIRFLPSNPFATSIGLQGGGLNAVSGLTLGANSKVVCDYGNEVVSFYSHNSGAGILELGGHEIDVLFKAKPLSNVIRFSLQSKGLKALLQPALSAAEITKGAVRPVNIVGSYALITTNPLHCHNHVQGKNYYTGKFAHLERPYIVDFVGTKTWCDWTTFDLVTNVATITIPQAALNSAVYPIRLLPTVGYTSIGASSITGNNNSIYGLANKNKYTASTGDTITKFSFYGSDSALTKVDMALYRIVSGIPTSRLAAAVQTAALAASAGWVDTGTVSQAMTAGNDYNTACGNFASTVALYYDVEAVANDVAFDAVQTLPATWNLTYSDAGAYVSMYATYTAGGSSNTVTTGNKLANITT